MSLYRTKKSPYWQYEFEIQCNRFYGSTGTDQKSLAKRIEDKKREEALKSIHFPEAKQMTLDIAFDHYFEKHAKFKKSSKDIEHKLETVISKLGADKFLTEITNLDIATYIAKRRSKVSDSSVNREITLLRAVYVYARDNLDAMVKMPNWKNHKLREPRGRIRSLTAEEEENLFKHLRPDFHPLVKFCLITGARVTSARRLTWTAVDLGAGEIKLEVKSKFLGEFHTLPITPEIGSLLASVKGQHPIYVFTYLSVGKVARRREKGKRYPFARDGWRRTWAKALKDAGIKDFRFHDLRHTAATQMLRATKNLAAVKEVLGHRDVTTTMRYAHVMKDDIRAALSRDSQNSPRIENETREKQPLKIVSSNG